MAGVPNDPDRIDIGLELVGSQSLEAVRSLTEQLSTVSEYLANFQNGSAEAQATGQTRIARTYTGRVAPSGGQYASHSSRSESVQDGAGQFASDADLIQQGNQGIFNRLRQGGFKGLADRELSIYGARERQQATRRGQYSLGGLDPSYAPLFGEQYQGGADQEMNFRGGVSEGASRPSPNDPVWRQSMRSNPVDWERAQEGFRLPPGGLSMNFQQKMEVGSDWLIRRAEMRYQQELLSRQQAALASAQNTADDSGQLNMFDENGRAIESLTPQDMNVDMSNFGSTAGSLGGLLRIGSQQAGVIQLAQDARGHLARGYAYGGALQQAGVQAGGQRAGQINIPGTNIGITNPLDFFNGNSAMREGLRQRINVQRLRLMGGINGTQANEIVGGLAQSGWVDRQGQNIAFDAIAPLVQQGQTPGLAVQSFDQIMRQGNASMADFVDTMSNLGQSAHAARLSLDEYQQGLSQFAETAQNLGATGTQGTQLGRNITDALGVAPQVAAEMIQAPLFQGMALQQGFLPNEVGLMHGQQAVSTTYQAIDMAMRATAGFANRPIRDSHGNIIASGRDRQIAQVSSILGPGYSTDVVKRLLRQRGFSTAAGQAEGQLRTLHNDLSAVDRANQAHSTETSRTIQLSGRGAPGVVIHSEHGGLTDDQQASADSALNRQWYQVLGTLRKGAPDPKTDPHGYAKYMSEVGDLSKGDNKERIAAATKFIRDHSQSQQTESGPVTYVKFKGAAAKFFEVDRTSSSKQDANAGGQSLASQMAGLPTARDQREFLQDYLKNESGGTIG